MEPEFKRPRKPNWTYDEIHLLLQELLVEGKKLFAANTIRNTTKNKATTWRSIAEKISAVGVSHRKSDEVRSKWKALRKEVTEKDADSTVTGGGKPKPRNIPFEELIRQVNGERSALFSGINVADCETRSAPSNLGRVSTSEAVHDPIVDVAIQGPTGNILDIPIYVNPENTSASESVFQSPGITELSHCQRQEISCMPFADAHQSLESQENISSQQDQSIVELSVPENQGTTVTPTAKPRGWMVRRLWRKWQSGRMTPSTSKYSTSDVTRELEDDSTLFQEYLKSEIEKNKVETEKLKKDIQESDIRVTLYENINKKVMLELQKYKAEAGKEASVTLDDVVETFV